MFYYDPMMGGNDWGMGILTMLLWFLFLTVLAVTVVRLLQGRDDTALGNRPIDIAKERYVKGEITKQQFEQLQKDLA